MSFGTVYKDRGIDYTGKTGQNWKDDKDAQKPQTTHEREGRKTINPLLSSTIQYTSIRTLCQTPHNSEKNDTGRRSPSKRKAVMGPSPHKNKKKRDTGQERANYTLKRTLNWKQHNGGGCIWQFWSNYCICSLCTVTIFKIILAFSCGLQCLIIQKSPY